MENKLIIRIAEKKDLSSVVDIYNQAIRAKDACGDLQEFKVEEKKAWFNTFNEHSYPIYVAEIENKVVGYCTLSQYRAGKNGFSTVAEISYYLDYKFHSQGIGTSLMKHALSDCPRIKKEILIAILFEINLESIKLLEKFNFEKWGYLPDVIEINGKKCAHLIYGLKIKAK